MKTTVILVLALLLASGISADEPAGTALTVDGDVVLQRGQETAALLPGTQLIPGDRVTSQNEGRATLLLSSGETVSVPRGSTVTIAAAAQPADGFAGTLQGLWKTVQDKFSESESTHAAMGTVGAVRGAEEEVYLEDYDYLGDDEAAHAEMLATLEEARDSEAIDGREFSLLAAVAAERFERYNTAESDYLAALTESARDAVLGGSGDLAAAREPVANQRAAIEADAVQFTSSDRQVIELMADLYARNDYYGRAAELIEIIEE